MSCIVRFSVEDACAPGLDQDTKTGREAEASWLALQVNSLPILNAAVPENGYIVTLHSRDTYSAVTSEVRCYRAPAENPRFVDRGV